MGRSSESLSVMTLRPSPSTAVTNATMATAMVRQSMWPSCDVGTDPAAFSTGWSGEPLLTAQKVRTATTSTYSGMKTLRPSLSLSPLSLPSGSSGAEYGGGGGGAGGEKSASIDS